MSAPAKLECVNCAKLPTYEESAVYLAGGSAFDEFRPKVPRKIDPRSLETHKTQPRCRTHWLAWRNRQRASAAAARSRKRSGLDEETRQAILAYQGGVCAACGQGSGRRLVLSADHDHDLAREHDHPDDMACIECLRGFICNRDNRNILGFLLTQRGATTQSVIQLLRNLADYLETPPVQSWRAGQAS